MNQWLARLRKSVKDAPLEILQEPKRFFVWAVDEGDEGYCAELSVRSSRGSGVATREEVFNLIRYCMNVLLIKPLDISIKTAYASAIVKSSLFTLVER